MPENITLKGLERVGFTDQKTQIVANGTLFDIWRKKWICIFVSRESSNSFSFFIYQDDKYGYVQDVEFIEQIADLFYTHTNTRLVE